MSSDPSGRRYRREESEPDREAVEGSRRGGGTPDYVPFGWPNLFGRGARDRDAERAGSYGDEVAPATRDGSAVPEGVAAAAIVVGIVMFLLPEPVTSLLGAGLVAGGVAALLWDATSGGK